MLPQALLEVLPKYIQGCKICNGEKVHIKESQWENVLHQACSALSLGHVWEHGSHKPGGDITIAGVNYSCKTTKTNNTSMSISSYRLTKVDNSDAAFTREIDVVRKNFEYYAILTRNTQGTCYSMYCIPASYFLASRLEWQKKGDNWHGVQKPESEFDYTMNITKKMSSQLWISCSLSAVEKFKLMNVNVSKLRSVSFGDIYDMVMKSHDSPSDSTSLPASALVSASASSSALVPATFEEAAEAAEEELSTHLANLALTSST